ncbi:hypothetical protein [Streptomyces sp. NPDC058486]|uniref:hypothetical protein n=1 Tax=unclassified Streptomyces TaxID=2593676 RepID=UPI00365D02CB
MDVALTAVASTLLGVIATSSAFAGAVVGYRHGQNDRWFRAQSVCDDGDLRRLAEAVFDETAPGLR